MNWKEESVIPQEPAEPTPAKDWFTEFELDFISSQFERLIEEVEDFDADNNHKLVKQLRKEFGL